MHACSSHLYNAIIVSDVTVTMKESVVEVAEGTTAQVCAVLTGHLERNVVVEISTTTTNSEAGVIKKIILTFLTVTVLISNRQYNLLSRVSAMHIIKCSFPRAKQIRVYCI